MLALSAIVALGACSKEQTMPEKVTKVSANIEELTKVSGDRSGVFTWTAGDAIGIWTGSSFTKFDIDHATIGTANVTFSCAGEVTLDENSFAVYPYSAASTYNTSTHLYKSGDLWNAQLHSNPIIVGEKVSYTFKHLNPLFRVELVNLPEEAKSVYFETFSGTGYFLRDEATADLSSANPVLSAGRLENKTYYNLTGKKSEVVYIPVLADTFVRDADGVRFVVQVKDAKNVTIKRVDAIIAKAKESITFQKGSYYYFPTMMYPSESSGDVRATMEGGLTWLEGQTIGLRKNSTTLTQFSLDAPGSTEGFFSGTIPTAAGLAVTPYNGATLNGSIVTFKFKAEDYATTPIMYAMANTSNPSYALDYSFMNLCATIRLTLNNIPAATNYIFLECGERPFFFLKGSADLSEAEPVIALLEDSKKESLMIKVPEHVGDIESWTVHVPILTGAYDNPPSGFKAECYVGDNIWTTKTTDAPRYYGLDFSSGISRGDVFDITLTFAPLTKP